MNDLALVRVLQRVGDLPSNPQRFVDGTNRAMRSASRERRRQHLMATSRPSFASRARYTSPVPPAPIAVRIS